MIKLIGILKEVKSLTEEYDGTQLLGYHVTSKSVIDSIAKDGLRAGQRKMQGEGFYAFYDKDRAIGYAAKDARDSGTVIVSFYVKSPNYKILYLNMDVAKEVLGDGYHLKDQIDNYFEFKGGIDYFLRQVRLGTGDDNYSMKELLQKLEDIENNNSESNQRTLIFQMIPADLNNSLNIVWNGYYGVEFRFSEVYRLIPYKYEEMIGKRGSFDLVEIEPGYSFIEDVLEKIPDVPENSELRDAIKDTDGTKMGLKRLKNHLEKMLDTVRSNRQYDKYNKMIAQLDKIGL